MAESQFAAEVVGVGNSFVNCYHQRLESPKSQKCLKGDLGELCLLYMAVVRPGCRVGLRKS